jgi:hypothetical protein
MPIVDEQRRAIVAERGANEPVQADIAERSS